MKNRKKVGITVLKFLIVNHRKKLMFSHNESSVWKLKDTRFCRCSSIIMFRIIVFHGFEKHKSLIYLMIN